jgi:hypothetical protein
MGENKELCSVLKPVLSMHDNLPNEEYHARPELSAHNLMDVEVSPAYADYKKKNPQASTDAMILGTLIHEATEDPESFHKKYAHGPDVKLNTKSGKDQWQIFQEVSEDKIPLRHHQFLTAERCSEAAWKHPEAKLFLEHSKKEISGFGQVLRTPVKARPDLDCSEFCNDLVDIKSRQLGKGSRDAWLKDFFNYKTFIQAGIQVEVWRQLGFTVHGYYYILIEIEPPYQVNVLPIDPEWIDIGIGMVTRAVQKWEAYLEKGRPEGYARNQQPMEVPDWMRRKLEWP